MAVRTGKVTQFHLTLFAHDVAIERQEALPVKDYAGLLIPVGVSDFLDCVHDVIENRRVEGDLSSLDPVHFSLERRRDVLTPNVSPDEHGLLLLQGLEVADGFASGRIDRIT